MKSSVLLALTATASAFHLQQRQSNWTVGQTVQTSSGPVTGHAAKNHSEVSEYLGIPYAQAPVGNLRFSAPVAFNGTATLNGSSFGLSCPVQPSSGSSYSAEGLAAANVTAVSVSILNNMSPVGAYGEDCLNLNIWTKPQTGEAKKAVLIWIYGGGFQSGTTDIPAYNGNNLAAEQDVVIVSINYRLNILGFPGSPTTPNNLGLLDQRLAVEWVRDNIAHFGGDPTRITLFGQSAGGASVDFYGYAWASDPIVAGLIPESGTAFSWGLPNQASRSAAAWYNVSQTLGCGNASSDSASVLSCMRSKNYTAIMAALPSLGGTAGILGSFGPTADDKVVFSNYSSRTPASVPMLIGNNNYEAGLFRTEFALAGIIYPDAFWDAFDLQEFTCPAGARANASVAAHNPTWRYRYFGIFPDTAISPEAGTWHAAEVPLLFNTNIPTPAATPAEIEIAAYMRGAWTTFAKDPKQGLIKYGWPTYNTSQDTLVRLAYNNITGPNLINPRRYDADCVFVNISSTDTSAAPASIPDLGASITPTGTASSTATSTASKTSATGTSTSSASPTGTTQNAAVRASYSATAWVVLAALFAAYLI